WLVLALLEHFQVSCSLSPTSPRSAQPATECPATFQAIFKIALVLMTLTSWLTGDAVSGDGQTVNEVATDGAWSKAELEKARQYSETIDTAAVVILHRGEVVDEWGPVAMPLMCHSVRKSLLSALYGNHVSSGAIDLGWTLERLGIDDNEPSLSTKERTATVGDLLKARSGVYHPALYETAAMAAKRPKRHSHDPNTFWYYNNWDFNAACTIFENATGRSVYEEFDNVIARPLGMQDFRRERDTGYVAGKDSVHPAYPFRLSTRDLAKFGQLMLQGGRWNERQLIPEDWVRESTASYSDTGDSGGYGYMWWVETEGRHFPGVKLPEGSFSARGFRGQYLLIIPRWALVICHRVNSFQNGTTVSKAEFGTLLTMILAARPDLPQTEVNDGNPLLPKQDLSQRRAVSPSVDLVIRNAGIVDGTGKAVFQSDLVVDGGVIRSVGPSGDVVADRTIDASGKLVAPGFIDLHSHAEQGLVSEDPARRSAPNLITQGITTAVVNQDGGGPIDIAAQRKEMLFRGIGMNVVQCIGHGTIRQAVMGDDHQRPATDQEIDQMKTHLQTAFDDGAFGLSAGLEYVPGRWSRPYEMECLAATVAEAGGVYIVHERSSGSRPMWFLPSRDSQSQPSMMDNLRELIEITAKTKVTAVATHIKARGTDYWGSAHEMNELIRKARASGLSIYADQYPYNTSGTDGRIVLIPSWVYTTDQVEGGDDKADPAAQLESVLSDEVRSTELRDDIEYEIMRRGGAEQILIVEHPDAKLIGKTLQNLAEEIDVEPVDAVIALQRAGDRKRRGGARLRAFSMSEQDVEAFAATDWTATSSDAQITLPTDGYVHPRFYGAFPRKIRHYAIDRELMTIEQAVRLSTSLPAQILKLENRGVIREGAVADLVIFDPNRIRDRADALNPHQYSEGIEVVMLGGKIVVQDEQWLGNLVGNVLVKNQTEK
ncbi:MAG: amidohydrolase family protein, partial [Planctomycetales bacterium]|nr:amidohydrolase family protein [Planctomycetales bacterium]